VTGASSGLGTDFARELAARGCRLVLVARREDRLRALAEELRTAHGTETRIETVDLADGSAREALAARLASAGLEVDVLVNNAGFGVYGEFLSIPWERERRMIELDVAAVVHLTKLFGAGMVGRGRGWILQVASIGAYQPSPTYASYSAAKAFVLSFGEALAFELRRTGVTVTVVSPGVTATEFLQVSGQQASLYQRLAMMKSPDVARAGVAAMLRGRSSVVPGLVNKVPAFLMRLTPRRLQARIAHLSMTMGQGPGPHAPTGR
jgi:short-subunit dehydrogenase